MNKDTVQLEREGDCRQWAELRAEWIIAQSLGS